MQELEKILEEIDRNNRKIWEKSVYRRKSNRSLLWIENSKRHHPQAHIS